MLGKLRRSSARDEAADVRATVDALRAVRDGLRAGRSLSQALTAASGLDGSPLRPLTSHLISGRVLPDLLRRVAASSPGDDLSFSLLVLSVQATVGGDPSGAVASLEARARRRLAAAREARALTTQARLSARAIQLLTPGFMCLLFALDPAGMARTLRSAAPLTALLAGLVLQGAGAAWIASIVGGPLRSTRAGTTKRSRLGSIPVLRVFSRSARSRRAGGCDAPVAYAAELVAMTLDAGLTPARALEVVAPAVPGAFGDALASAVARARAGAGQWSALSHSVAMLSPAAARFARAMKDAASLGVPLAETMRSIAADIEAESHAQLAEDVRVASMKVLLPLGLLVLPAFVLSCLVPLFLNGLRGIAL